MQKFTIFLLLIVFAWACDSPATSNSTGGDSPDSSATSGIAEESGQPSVADVDDPGKKEIVFPLVYTSEGKRIRLHKVETGDVDPELFGKEDFLEKDAEFKPVKENGCFQLPLTNGSTGELCDIPDDGMTDAYRVNGYWGAVEGTDFWLFFVDMYEGSETEIVSQTTGKRTATLPNIAVSPDRQHIMGFHSMDAYGWTSIEMLDIVEGAIERQWSFEMEDWGPESIYWAPDGQIYIQAIFGGEMEEHRPEHYLRVEVDEAP